MAAVVPCYHPIRAWQRGVAAPIFFAPSGYGYRSFEVPCGQCVGCRLRRSRETAVRCVHESQMHPVSCFATFTYAPEYLPKDGSLDYRHFQLFMKVLRESKRCHDGPNWPIRFFCAGEYGGLSWRPHYHALLFGYRPRDLVFYKMDRDCRLYSSAELDAFWKLGSVTVGEVTFESAAYCARYLMSKDLGSGYLEKEFLDVSTGELRCVVPEFCKQSLRPGLGARWLSRYFSDVFPHDRAVIGGRKVEVPRYYDKQLEKLSPLYLAELKAERVEKAGKRFPLDLKGGEGSPRRRRDSETVARAKIGLLPRSDL